MKYVGNPYPHIGNVSYVRRTEVDKTLFNEDTNLENLSHKQLFAILVNSYTIYPLSLNILPYEGNPCKPSQALAKYILDRSFPLSEPTFKNIAGKVTEFLKSVDLDPDNYLVFPADKEVFKNNFLESDYLTKGKACHVSSGVYSLIGFYEGPILDIQFKEILLNWNNSEHKIPVVGSDGQQFSITLSSDETHYYLNLPIWEFIWQCLIYSQNLIEINGYCLVDKAGFETIANNHIFLTDTINPTMEILEVISKVPLISKALEAERLKFVASMKMFQDKLNSLYFNFIQLVESEYRSRTEAEIDNLKKNIGQKSVKEVANSYGW